MGNTWHADVEHFLDVDGYPVLDLPRPAERLVEYFASIIEAVTSRDEKKALKTAGIRCCRRPGHRRGFISGWRGTMGDKVVENRGPVG